MIARLDVVLNALEGVRRSGKGFVSRQIGGNHG